MAYEHLVPNKEYTLKGVVMDKATNQPMIINGRKIAVEKVFVPETPSGKITVRFRIHATEIKRQTDLVVFETLYDEGQEIAVHCDINDKGQTVTVKIPQIKTTAMSDGQKDITAEKEITVIDTVEYANLIVGKEYKVSGVLMDRKTGRPLTENGKNIISETVFTAEKENGEITVKFVFDGSVITEDTEVVVFEKESKLSKKLYATGNGRCNLLNKNLNKDKYNHPDFMAPILEKYGYPFLEGVLKSLGIEVASSGNLLQRFSALYSDRAYELQLLANKKTLMIKDEAFAKIKELIPYGKSSLDFNQTLYFIYKIMKIKAFV